MSSAMALQHPASVVHLTLVVHAIHKDNMYTNMVAFEATGMSL